MMFDCQVKLGKQWHHSNGISVVGAAFEGRRLLKRELMTTYFTDVSNWQDFLRKVKTLNGFFAVVVVRENVCYAAVDRMRSIPLFYAMQDDTFLLSDDPEWLEIKLGFSKRDPVSLAEFLLAGYTTERHTLNPEIHQIQAGEAVMFSKSEEGCSLFAEQYYQFVTGKHGEEDISENDLLHELERVTFRAIERLIEIAHDRPIVIPLSGGLDSRLIAMILKRLGYRNVQAFTYGLKNNWEAKVSQSVAKQLGIPWYFVEYKPELWRNWYWSDECQEYIKFGGKLTSLAHLQDWPAIKELTKQGVILPESVIVPGHTGDFISGGHIPFELTRQRSYSAKDVINAIWEHHYVLMPLDIASLYAGISPKKAHEHLFKRLQFCIGHVDNLSNSEAVGLYERWEWSERQAKYIVNSVRVYDFFGLDWWLPWWDVEVMEFWEKVPLELRLQRQLYRQYIKHVENEINVFWGSALPLTQRIRNSQIARKLLAIPEIQQLYRKLVAVIPRKEPILSLHGLQRVANVRKEVSILGTLALAQLGFVNVEEAK